MDKIKFVKRDKGKPPAQHLPGAALLGAALAMGVGVTKYGEGNWKRCQDPRAFYGAALRHLLAWADGEKNDPESGLSHLDHAAASVLILSALEKTK